MLLTTKQKQKHFFLHTSHSLSNYAHRYFVCLVCTIYNAHFIERLIIPSKSSSNFTEIRKYFNPLSPKLIKRKTLLLNKSAYLFCKKKWFTKLLCETFSRKYQESMDLGDVRD